MRELEWKICSTGFPGRKKQETGINHQPANGPQEEMSNTIFVNKDLTLEQASGDDHYQILRRNGSSGFMNWYSNGEVFIDSNLTADELIALGQFVKGRTTPDPFEYQENE